MLPLLSEWWSSLLLTSHNAISLQSQAAELRHVWLNEMWPLLSDWMVEFTFFNEPRRNITAITGRRIKARVTGWDVSTLEWMVEFTFINEPQCDITAITGHRFEARVTGCVTRSRRGSRGVSVPWCTVLTRCVQKGEKKKKLRRQVCVLEIQIEPVSIIMKFWPGVYWK